MPWVPTDEEMNFLGFEKRKDINPLPGASFRDYGYTNNVFLLNVWDGGELCLWFNGGNVTVRNKRHLGAITIALDRPQLGPKPSEF